MSLAFDFQLVASIGLATVLIIQPAPSGFGFLASWTSVSYVLTYASMFGM